MTIKQETSRLDYLKDEALKAYLMLQNTKLSSLEKLEWTLKYEHAKNNLAEYIQSEFT